jgi:hypothetical protein
LSPYKQFLNLCTIPLVLFLKDGVESEGVLGVVSSIPGFHPHGHQEQLLPTIVITRNVSNIATQSWYIIAQILSEETVFI